MTIEITVPELGESVIEATIQQWLKKEGDFVEVGEPLVELETDKVNLEVSAKASGVLSHIIVPEGQDVKIGDVLGMIDSEAKQSASTALPAMTLPTEPVSDSYSPIKEMDETVPKRTLLATPVAARMAQEEKIDLALVHGTGSEGRVTKSDVEQYRQSQATNESEPSKLRSPQPVMPMIADLASRKEERQRMSRRRRTIAQRLLEATQTTAMLTTFNEINMAAVMDLRSRRNESFQARHGIKLGITSFFIKASLSALKAFPRLNAEIQEDAIVLKHYYDIGLAVGATEGLVVPVIRDADRLSIAETEQEIKNFVTKVENGSLSLEDLRGGTFTITNGGVFGSLLSTPILSIPQVAILGLHKIEDRPVAQNGEVMIQPMMYVALSYDHRIVDGREAVQFLVHIKDLIEDPERLLLEG
jgi:2-oxoglutarate dehydrogenase E2 component (dihydrolipoamide succinyltransferase)